MTRERYVVADLVLDVGAASVVREGGERIELPQLSFDLLVALARRAPDVVASEALIATVWAGLAVSDETLTQRVALLRRALGDDAKSPRYVKAVRGRGYQLVPAVRALGEDRTSASIPRRRWTAIALASAAALGLAMVVVALARRSESGAPAGAPAAAPGSLGAHGSPAADVLSTRPPQVPELLARAGTYLARHLEADNELAVELYRRVLGLEPENADALAGLSLALAQRTTKFNRSGREGEEAEALARRAVAFDPGLGRAHLALGMALDSQSRVSPALDAYRRAAELGPEPSRALASAANLLQVQGRLAEALAANLEAARRAGESPIYLEVQLGITLGLLGFDGAAAVWFERALELKPDNVFAAAFFAQFRLSRGRASEADAIAAAAIARGIRRPELPLARGTVALLEGDAARARSRFEEARAIDPGDPRAETRLLVLARRDAGADQKALAHRARELLAHLAESRAQGDEWPDRALDEVVLAAGFGDEAAALAALDTAIRLGYRDAGWLRLDPLLAGLRDRPAFGERLEIIQALVEAERQRVLGAPWLPPSLLAGSAARM